jgi:ribonuclease BN (tRNA processing enzyme)
LDLGTGAFANLRRHADYDRLGAVVISHMHADHFIDLVPLRYALKYGSRRRAHKLPVHLPPGGLAMLRAFAAAFPSEPGAFLDDVFALAEYDPSQPLAIEGATLRFAHTAHYIPAFAVRWERDGASVTYSADTAPDGRVVALARDCDVFVCEATLLHGAVERGIAGHCTAAGAAAMARDAGVRRLLLSHYGAESTSRDLDEAAREVFRGEIIVADDHHTVELTA